MSITKFTGIKLLLDEIKEPDEVVNVDQCPAQFRYLSTQLNYFLEAVAEGIPSKSERTL